MYDIIGLILPAVRIIKIEATLLISNSIIAYYTLCSPAAESQQNPPVCNGTEVNVTVKRVPALRLFS